MKGDELFSDTEVVRRPPPRYGRGVVQHELPIDADELIFNESQRYGFICCVHAFGDSMILQRHIDWFFNTAAMIIYSLGYMVRALMLPPLLPDGGRHRFVSQHAVLAVAAGNCC